MEINPPFAFYLMAPFTIAGRVTGIPDALVLYLGVLGLIGLSLSLSAALLDRIPTVSARTANCYLLAAALLLVFAPLAQYGQREHLMLILILPWLTLAAFGGEGSRPTMQRAGIAAIASVGLILKPHFMLAPAALAVLQAIGTRSWRPLFAAEMLVFGAAGIVYVAFVATVHPDYFTHVVPLALNGYGGYDAPFLALIRQPVTIGILATAAVVVYSAFGGRRTEPAVFALGTVAIAFFASYLLQAKGWGYQALPAAVCAGLAGVVFTADAAPLRRPVLVALGLVPIGTALLLAAVTILPEKRYDSAAIFPDVAKRVRGNTYLALSVDLTHQFPFVNEAGAIYVSRYPCLWPLPGMLRALESDNDKTRSDRERTSAILRSDIAADMAKGRPDFVMVQTADARRYLPPGVDLIAFFSLDPAFAAEWSHYRQVTSDSRYALYERQSAEAAMRKTLPGHNSAAQ